MGKLLATAAAVALVAVAAWGQKAPAPTQAPSAARAEDASAAGQGAATSRAEGGIPARVQDASAPAQGAAVSIFEAAGEPSAVGAIDRAIFARLAEEGIRPSRLCSDAVFVRRAFLDLLGTLPTAEEVEAFLGDTSTDKRSRLVDQLLEREEFADYWTLRWCDVLRVKSEFPINLWPNAVQAYHQWVRSSVRRNLPYDEFVRALLTSSGSNFRVPQVNFYRAVQGRDPASLARTVALTFMGDRMESWPAERRDGMAVFFSRVGFKGTVEWKEEIILFDRSAPSTATAVLPDGKTISLDAETDPRAVFADWLLSPGNPWAARCAVNRVWFWLMGRGLIHEPDDVRPDNPSSHPEALRHLETELVAHRYDLRHIVRLIMNSSTYQLSAVPRSEDPRAAELFGRCLVSRLDAEVLIDALCRVTGTTEEYSSAIPEPFTWVPKEKRSIELPDGSITSSFLEVFGRPARDSGMAAERNNSPTAAQQLHLLNSGHVRTKIERGPALQRVQVMAKDDPEKAVRWVYLTVLSRPPTDHEREILKAYTGDKRSKKDVYPLVDMMWALINSVEFQYRH
jgi:hypothetical protein